MKLLPFLRALFSVFLPPKASQIEDSQKVFEELAMLAESEACASKDVSKSKTNDELYREVVSGISTGSIPLQLGMYTTQADLDNLKKVV